MTFFHYSHAKKVRLGIILRCSLRQSLLSLANILGTHNWRQLIPTKHFPCSLSIRTTAAERWVSSGWDLVGVSEI